MSSSAQSMSQRIDKLEPSAVAEMLEQGRKLSAKGREIIPLVQGEPSIYTPPHICAAASQALAEGHTHYIPTQGLIALRKAVADKLKRENGFTADPATEVLITTGATMGLYIAMLAILDPGDEVLLPNPSYGPFQSIIALSGGVHKFIRMVEQEGHFRLAEDGIESVVGPRTKAIIVCSPNNPTGDILSIDELKAVERVASKHGLFIVADEVYEKLIYDGREHASMMAVAPELREQIIIINSFSKTYAMTGWRLGYNVANPTLTKAMSTIHQVSGRMPAAFVQYAGIAALEGPQDIIEEMVRTYKNRRDMLLDGLEDVPGMLCPCPEGTFYMFIDARETGLDSWTLAKRLLEMRGLITTPGSHYGPNGDGHLRLADHQYACSCNNPIGSLRECFESL